MDDPENTHSSSSICTCAKCLLFPGLTIVTKTQITGSIVMTVLEEGRRLRFGGPSGRPFRFDFSTLVGFLSTSVTTFI